MAGGLFELRRDDITGWWVATVVDRQFDRTRFARPARRLASPDEACQNCRSAPHERAWLRVLKPQAFTIAGGQPALRARESGREGSRDAARELGRPEPGREPGRPDGPREPGRDASRDGAGDTTGEPARESAAPEAEGEERTLGLIGDVGSWETIAAPFGHHGSLADERRGLVIEMLELARQRIVDARRAGGTRYLQVVQNWGEQAGAMTNHLCFDVYDLPDIPHRLGEELGGAARYVIREGACPWCRLVENEVARRDRLVFDDAASVCFAPYASRSPFELWIVPRHHEADFGISTDDQLTSAAETLQKVIRMLDTLDGPAYNLVLHTAPLHENVRETYHWHWEIHPRLREVGGLELGTGLPVNPISPEDAVDELLAATRALVGSTEREEESAGRSWDSFPRR